MKAARLLSIFGFCGWSLTASVALAQDRDYTWILNQLRAEGISPSSIQWSDIESQCMPLKQSDMASYQECRLGKARLQADFREDKQSCDDTADAFRPNNLRYRAVVLEESSPQSGATLTLLNTAPAVANAQAFHRHLFNQCMRGLGWRSPRDYRRGRME